MIEHGVGVRISRAIEFKRLDEDFFSRFNAAGPDGLFDNWTDGPTPRLSSDQLAEFAKIVETGPDRKVDGVVRWRRIDLKRVIAERFGVDLSRALCRQASQETRLFSHEPRHPAQDERIAGGYLPLP